MGKLTFLFVGFYLIVSIVCPVQPVAAPYYEGKTIRIVVGSEPGGGYDRMARLLAKHLPKHIPGKPLIIVENMPGAGSIIAANHIYSIAKPDGLTIGAVQRGLPYYQLLKAEGVKYDAIKYSWIGSPSVEATVLTLRTDLPYKTFDDLRKAKGPIHLSGAGPGASDYQFALILKEFFGLNLNMIIYPSSSAQVLAIERKEVDGRGGSYSSLKPFIERGLVRPLIRGRVAEPGIEDLPVDEDLVSDKMGKAIMTMRSAGDFMGRPYLASPGTPADVVNILREAFANVIKDSELKEESKKVRMEVEYVSADKCLKILDSLFRQPEEIIREFSKYVKL